MDNWKHRTTGMGCATCMWFAQKYADQTNNPGDISSKDPRGNIGRCRRHAPTMAGFPVVFSTDWCGDHKLDENKI